ncbi:hypothetical protein IJ732_06500, partial [bacterium]|nr:hypothetical protein [bacterium]
GGLDCGKYILTYHKLFDGLINNCTAYDNGECSQCENGYQNNGSSCRDIRENTCDTYSGTTCTKCTTENLLVDNECVSKTSLHCQTSDGVSCTECESGNYLKSGSCNENPSFCNSVSDEGETCIIVKDSNSTVTYKIGDLYASSQYPSTDYNDCDWEQVWRYSSGHISCSGYYPDGMTWYFGADRNDYWAGAAKTCTDKGMRLPTNDEAQEIIDECNKPENADNVACTSLNGAYFTSEEGTSTSDYTPVSYFTKRNLNVNGTSKVMAHLGVYCVKK